MRGNPYPDGTPPALRRALNLFYSASQVGATMIVMSSRDTVALLWVLLPIQLAPFLMTLVKKGILNQAGWHLWYTLSLLVNWAYRYVWRVEQSRVGPVAPVHSMAMWGALCVLRLGLGANKYALWAAACAFAVYASSSGR
jgi:hypothetical protein